MTARLHLAALVALWLGPLPLGAGEAKPPAALEPAAKAPPAEPKKEAAKPAPEAPPTDALPESDAARRERLGKVYDAAEALYQEGRLADAQKLYAQIALEDPNFRRVASRLATLRTKLQDQEARARDAQIAQLLAEADAHFAGGNYEAAAKACETVLAIQPNNRRAQDRLGASANELELRRRMASVIAEPGAGARRVVAQAGTALREAPAAPAQLGPSKPPAQLGLPPATRPAGQPEPSKTARLVSPQENREVPQPAAKPEPAGAEADPEGSRLIQEAWDIAEGAKLAADPRPALHKALDTLAPITATTNHSERNKQTAALLRRSISRRLADGGSRLSPEESLRAKLYQRYLDAEDLFRKKRYDDCIKATTDILAEDRHFHLARTLNQEARIRSNEDKALDKDLEHRLAFDRRMEEIEALSVPHDMAAPIQRPAIDLSRPTVRVTSPELEEKLNQRVSVNLIAADLDYFLDLLFRSTGVNLIYNPDVVTGKTITVHIANYPLRQLLDYIAKNHGLMFTTTQDGVLITTPDQPVLEAFVLPLNYGLVDVEEAPWSGSIAAKGGAQPPQQPPTTSNVEKLIAALPSLLGADWPQGSFTYLDRKMNLLYLRTTRDAYREVVRMLDPIDQIPIQVLIKTLFIEINADEFESAGINIEQKGDLGRGDFKLLEGKIIQFGAESFTETAGTNPTLRLAGVVDDAEFQLILDAIQRTTRSRTLAAPNVICINNCTATISITTTLIYIEDYEVDRSDISGVSYGNPFFQQQLPPGQQQQFFPPLSSEPIITPVFAEDEYVGFSLDVCPSVGKDTRFISLNLNPRIREEVLPRKKFKIYLPTNTPITPTQPGQQQPQQATAGFQEVEVERPIIAEKALSTKLYAADGAIVILGGLIQQKKTQIRSKVPWLGDLPLLGWLFSNTSYRDSKTNLLIFVQAEVITPTGARYADSGQVDARAAPNGAPPSVTVEERRPPAVQPAPLP